MLLLLVVVLLDADVEEEARGGPVGLWKGNRTPETGLAGEVGEVGEVGELPVDRLLLLLWEARSLAVPRCTGEPRGLA